MTTQWLGGTLLVVVWLGLGDATAAHHHGLGCDFGYDFSQMTKMCIVTLIVTPCVAVPSSAPARRTRWAFLEAWVAVAPRFVPP